MTRGNRVPLILADDELGMLDELVEYESTSARGLIRHGRADRSNLLRALIYQQYDRKIRKKSK